jgi:hypothetical protein
MPPFLETFGDLFFRWWDGWISFVAAGVTAGISDPCLES